MSLLLAGHHGVDLAEREAATLAMWIDSNGVYYGWYREEWPDRRIFPKRTGEALDRVFERRCASCHAGEAGRRAVRFPSLDFRRPGRSRILLAPLAEAAGGWQACGEAVFGDRADPDHASIARAIEDVARALRERPRRDMLELSAP
jgi:hypothetical protein